MPKPAVYVWRSVPGNGEFTAEEISDASYHLLASLALDIPHKQVLIKPNVTIATPRESGIDTDCAHVEGIVRWLLDNGRKNTQVAIGEGGGGPTPLSYCVSGFADLAYAYDIALHSFNDLRLEFVVQDCDFVADRIRHIGRGQRLAWRAIDPDVFLINAPKLKTHNAMAISICMKNLMGTQHPHDRSLCSISRQYAQETHVDYEFRFAHEMCNLYERVAPDFHVVDGVISRMGSGFHDGENWPLGLTVAGVDGFAVDFACSHFMGFNPEHLLLFQVAHQKGLAPGNIGDIDVKLVSPDSIVDVSGDELEELCSPKGFWVKYHRGELEEFYPGLYRTQIMPRHSDHA